MFLAYFSLLGFLFQLLFFGHRIGGIELMAMIKKGQMKTTKGDDQSPAELFCALAA